MLSPPFAIVTAATPTSLTVTVPARAGTGAVTGAIIGWIFGVFSWIHPLIAGLTLAAYGLITGAIIGAVIGLILYAAQRGRRDFTAVRAMQPSRYEVVVGDEVADEAGRLLGARFGAHAKTT